MVGGCNTCEYNTTTITATMADGSLQSVTSSFGLYVEILVKYAAEGDRWARKDFEDLKWMPA